MEGSSESGCRQGADTSRGLNSSFFDRNPRILRRNTVRFSGDSSASHDTGYLSSVRKDRERNSWPHLNSYTAQVDDSDVGGGGGGAAGGPPIDRTVQCSDISLRQWLDNPERTLDSLECLHIFSQIVDFVNLAHSQGIVVHNVRPSCFVMSSFNRVSFIESTSCSESGSDSQEYDSPHLPHDSGNQSGVLDGFGLVSGNPANVASQVNSETSCLQQSCTSRHVHALESEDKNNNNNNSKKHSFLKQILLMESNWYTAPEEVSGGDTSCASDIYQLGILLFELFCTFSSMEEKSLTMASLRHRLLPPQLLLKWPKEASFCLWLLHPDASGRPKIGGKCPIHEPIGHGFNSCRESKKLKTASLPFGRGKAAYYPTSLRSFKCGIYRLMRSEFLNEPKNDIEEREAAIELHEEIEEHDLLLEFLLTLRQKKQDAADTLNEAISFISSDIEEATKMQTALRTKGGPNIESTKNAPLNPHLTNIADDDHSSASGSRKRIRQGLDITSPDESYDRAGNQETAFSKNYRLMKYFEKVESAYFLTRRMAVKPPSWSLGRHSLTSSGGGASVTERSSISNPSPKELNNENKQSGWISTFLEGLRRYLAFSKIKVKADLKHGDLLNSSNLVCSLSFDRDGEFFATAGVNKKIKVFEYNSILNEEHDIYYPVVELASRSKLSSICWNSYIKSQIVSSNFEGVVQVWDVTRNQAFMEMKEHERRVWSVDFSVVDPTLLASGSDDGSVKLWNINQGASVGTIRTMANVCCVQFPTDSGRTLAFGSADHKVYYYDLRNSKVPLCTLVGHNKTVSYVKFLDSTTLVSASTDNTLKLWDLSMCTSRVLDRPLQSFTGHLNLKNFVGLSVYEGYIATGSETNEVFVYHKAFSMPALSFKFNSMDPFSGEEMDDTAQFISSVCWRSQSSTLLAANSMGNVKLLEMA
ncbi:hypothetical protein OROGR_012320 [Orobanche gracilis]